MVKTTAGVVHHASRRAVWPKPRGITTTGTVAMILPNVVDHVAAARREPNLLHRPRVEQAPARCLADRPGSSRCSAGLQTCLTASRCSARLQTATRQAGE